MAVLRRVIILLLLVGACCFTALSQTTCTNTRKRESVKDVIPLAGREDNLEGVRILMHFAIVHANIVGAPKGQPLQQPVAAAANSPSKDNYGTIFYMSEMRVTANHGSSNVSPIPFYVRIACNKNGFVYITAPGFGLNGQPYWISPPLTTIEVRPTSNSLNRTVSKTGILLETSVDCAIFVLDKAKSNLFAVDGMMLIPEHALGKSYVIPAFYKGNGFPRFKVVGTQDTTSVNVTFMSNMTNELYGNGAPSRFFKYMRQTYSVNYLEVINFHLTYGDPAGTIIESDKPVAVIYDDPSAIITPNFTRGGTFDKTSSQLIPVSQWGTHYVVPPVYPRSKYLVRVFAYYNDTFLNLWSPTKLLAATINRGEFKEYIMSGNEPLTVRGTHPISVYQYSFSAATGNDGHSSMILVPSLDRFAEGPITFPTMASLDNDYLRHFTYYASIIIEKQFKVQLKYNGAYLHPVTTYSVRGLDEYVVVIAKLNSTATVHTVTNSYLSGARFGLLVYGISLANQFGFVGGMSFIEKVCGLTTTIPTSSVAMSTTPVTGKGPRCYSCSHIPHLRYCDTLQQCQDGQMCFVERQTSASGTHFYSAGCAQAQTCQVNQHSPTSSSDKCFSCCGSNFCNNAGCGDQGPSSSNGPLCFDCQNFDDPTTCDRVTLCSSDEVCSIEEYRWGSTDKIYKMGCAQKHTCPSISGHIRRSVPVCHSCCAKNYCNMNCTSSQGTVAVVG